jgi:hypothetical protein
MAQATSTQLTDIFQKCAPALRSDISRCGTVTTCANIKVETIDSLLTDYTQDGEWKILEHLLMTHFTLKACGSVQHGMRDFFMANAKITRKGELKFDENGRALSRIAPFVLADQKIPLNNVFWDFSNGESDANEGTDWQGDFQSKSGVPADIRTFPVGSNLWIVSIGEGGVKTKTQWVIANAELTVDGLSVHVELTDQNSGSLFPAASLTNPATGVGYLGIPNVGKTERYCDDRPAYANTKKVPFWIQHTRWTSCNSELFNEWRNLVLTNNPMYKESYYVPDVERNRQMVEQFENNLFNVLRYQGAINDKQNLKDYNQLPEITNFLPSDFAIELGAEGGRCYGRKANAIGWYEQLRECDRWYDAAGEPLNLYSIFDAIYQMNRVRAGIGSAAQRRFDTFCSGDVAEYVENMMIGFNDLKFGGKEQYIMNRTTGSNEELGLSFTSYILGGKNNGVVWNIITDWAFDDEASQFVNAGLDNAGNTMFFLDMTGMYMKVIESSVKTNHTGDLSVLANMGLGYDCVEETLTKDTTLNGLTFAAVVECAAADLILDNFDIGTPGVFAANTKPAGSHPNYIPGTTITPYAI